MADDRNPQPLNQEEQARIAQIVEQAGLPPMPVNNPRLRRQDAENLGEGAPMPPIVPNQNNRGQGGVGR